MALSGKSWITLTGQSQLHLNLKHPKTIWDKNTFQ